jgi:catalase
MRARTLLLLSVLLFIYVRASTIGDAKDTVIDTLKDIKDSASEKMFKTPTSDNAKINDLAQDKVDLGEKMTTNAGTWVPNDQDQLKVGARGPSLLEDHHYREKMMHFDHERIPERVVHARGSGAHGFFQVYEDMSEYTMAKFLHDPSKKTPVFVRFSTVAGSKGSIDTPRDVRGFATKFYTDEGIWDLVGNNIPVFFIQDAIKFVDIIHAVKPEPHNEIPQAQSAHDTFWDFVSLTPESTHMLMWVMSDRALPRSFSTMEGFGVHTFKFVNAAGKVRFVKFHWKPVNGASSLVWDEAQKVGGKDPDFNRKDLFDNLESGNAFEWELGVQMVDLEDEHKFDFDLLDATKIIPEELVPVKIIGKMSLNQNIDNFHSETEQVAFNPGHIVPGIDFTDDPLLQGRLFSYLDTQLLRVGPNFMELPINRPINPVHNNNRNGFARHTINKGRVSYFPNSLGGGCPMHTPEGRAAYSGFASQKIAGHKIRQRSPSFSDHFSQATLFWNSMSNWEKDHIVNAFSFELNMVQDKGVRNRTLNELLVNVHPDLASRVSYNIGVDVLSQRVDVDIDGSSKTEKKTVKVSPALSLDKPAKSLKGRKVAILAGDGVDGKQLEAFRATMKSEGVITEVINKKMGTIKGSDGTVITVDKHAANAASVLYDGVFIPDGSQNDELKGMGIAVHFVRESFVHYKPIAAYGKGVELLKTAGVPVDPKLGVVTKDDSGAGFITALKQHRFFSRKVDTIAA